MKFKLILFTIVGILLNELIVINALPSPFLRVRQAPAAAPADNTLGTFTIVGDSGVNAMHAALVTSKKVVFVDKLEQNHLKRADGLAALSSEYDIYTNQIRPLGIYTNTFCSAGSFLGNGTLIEVGGDKGDANYRTGIQTARVYDPAVGDWIELENVLPSNRWYPAMVSLPDGNVMIVGGSTAATGVNRADINNPTYAIYPPPTGKVTDVPIPFLTETLPYNLYPMVHVIPNNNGATQLFILANQASITYDVASGKVIEQHPKIAGGIRSYPLTGTSVMLPLSSVDNYRPIVMVCGGNVAYEITSPADSSCGRIDLSVTGSTWEMDDFGKVPRVMPDATFLVDGTLLFINGAGTGYAGYRKGGGANALWVNENPVFAPSLYDPSKKTYQPLAKSTIPRMYHSVSTLLPDGSVLVAGSNPQGAVAANVKYSTEYRVENFKPPYLFSGIPRPAIVSFQNTQVGDSRINVNYGQEITITVQIKAGNSQPSLKAAIIHHGFVTHSQNFSQRYVYLDITNFYVDSSAADQYILTAKLPPNPTIIAPGPSFIYVSNQGSPCTTGVPVLLNVATT